MREELLEEAARAVELARASGADGVCASVGASRGRDFTWRGGRLEKVQEDTSRRLSVALYVDGRFSTHATNDLEPARLRTFLADAVALTRLLERDPFRCIPDPALYADRPRIDLELSDPALDALSTEDCLELCRALHDAAADHPAVVSVQSRVMVGQGASARVTSNGFADAEAGGSLWYGAEVSARDGDARVPEASRYAGARHRADLPDPRRLGREALERVLARQGEAKLASARTTLVLDPLAAASLLGRVLGVLTAGAVQQGRSYLAGKRGAALASPLLSLTDDPLIPRGLASRRYDGEGISARPLALVEGGVLANYYVDTYYGRKLGWEPTSGSRSNVRVALGEHDLAGLVRAAGSGFYVRGWLGGNANPTSGDFSFGFQGQRIEGGALGAPVSEMNVTGNFLELLPRLAALGNDPDPSSTLMAPSLLFEDVEFSGR